LAHYNFIWTQSPAARPVVYTAALLIDYTYIAYNLWEVWWLDRSLLFIFFPIFFSVSTIMMMMIIIIKYTDVLSARCCYLTASCNGQRDDRQAHNMSSKRWEKLNGQNYFKSSFTSLCFCCFFFCWK
jgi:hypothetical protein